MSFRLPVCLSLSVVCVCVCGDHVSRFESRFSYCHVNWREGFFSRCIISGSLSFSFDLPTPIILLRYLIDHQLLSSFVLPSSWCFTPLLTTNYRVQKRPPITLPSSLLFGLSALPPSHLVLLF